MKAFAVITFFASAVFGYQTGAPLCVNAPRHGGGPQESDHGLDIEKTIDNGIATITISSPDEFIGFLLTTKSPGQFEVADDSMQVIPCTGIQLSLESEYTAITHTSKTKKKDLTVTFVQEEGSEQEPVFNLIIVQEYDIYWNNIEI